MSKVVRAAFQYILWFGAVLLLSFLLIHFVAQRTDVNGTSMVPTLEDGDQLIADKVTYRFRDPERFDIIIFPYQYAEKTYFIKRIIGLPGERVRIDEQGKIYINGKVLEEHYGREQMVNPGLNGRILSAGRGSAFIRFPDSES